MKVERIPITNRTDWLEWRKRDVTASVVGALPGLGACYPFMTALQLYVEKKGVEIKRRDSAAMRQGRRLEPGIAQEFAEQHPEWRIEPPNVYLRDPALHLGATPDFYILGDPRGLGVLECKSTTPEVYAEEWRCGSVAPRWVELQTRTQMMLAGAAFGVIAVTDQYGHEPVTGLPVERDDAEEAAIVAAVRAFWDDVANNRDPQPDFERDTVAINALTREIAAGTVVDLTGNNELPGMLAERAGLKEQIKELENRCTAIDNEIKFLMGTAARAIGLPDWSISYPLVVKEPHMTKGSSHRQLYINPRHPNSRDRHA